MVICAAETKFAQTLQIIPLYRFEQEYPPDWGRRFISTNQKDCIKTYLEYK